MLAMCLLVSTFACAQQLDPLHSRVGFELHTRWGQALQGYFPAYEGKVVQLDDGRRQVHLRLDVAQVEIIDHPHYTRFARGERFFDVERHPHIEFVSEAYSEQLLQTGGKLKGRLRILGVEREEVFVLQPATCAQPGQDCDVVSHGSIDRDDYGLDGWKLALRDEVDFSLRMRVLVPTPAPTPTPTPTLVPAAVPAPTPVPVPAS